MPDLLYLHPDGTNSLLRGGFLLPCRPKTIRTCTVQHSNDGSPIADGILLA
jgi:hypothetical protein